MRDESMEENGEQKNLSKYIIGVFLLALILWLGWPVIIGLLLDTLDERGAFGDLYGGINALFSGLALAGVICAILLQREELRLQRVDLRQTRAELARSAEAQERSEKALARQAEIMSITAELTALSAQLRYFQDQIDSVPDTSAYRAKRAKFSTPRDAIMSRLKQAGERLEIYTKSDEAESEG